MVMTKHMPNIATATAIDTATSGFIRRAAHGRARGSRALCCVTPGGLVGEFRGEFRYFAPHDLVLPMQELALPRWPDPRLQLVSTPARQAPHPAGDGAARARAAGISTPSRGADIAGLPVGEDHRAGSYNAYPVRGTLRAEGILPAQGACSVLSLIHI